MGMYIETDKNGYHRLACGCKIGRLMSVYCIIHNAKDMQPHNEQKIIRRIWVKATKGSVIE